MERHTENTEKSLINRLREGDVSALSALYMTHHRHLLYYILKTTKSMRLAEDIVHDSFIRIWENRQKLDAERPLKPLLFTVAKRELLNILARASRETEIMNELERSVTALGETASAALEYREQKELLEEAIAQLPPRCRLVFEKCHIEGLSHAEVASTLGISESTVNNQMVKAWAYIRSHIKLKDGLALLIAAILS